MSHLFFPSAYFRDLYSVIVAVIALLVGGASPLSFAESLRLTPNKGAAYLDIDLTFNQDRLSTRGP